jgi:hypothetical protein
MAGGRGGCPIDGNSSELIPATVHVKTAVALLDISCPFSDQGCIQWLKIHSLDNHLKSCPFNPSFSGDIEGKSHVEEMPLKSDTRVSLLESHVQVLRKELTALNDQVQVMVKKEAEYEVTLMGLQQDNQELKKSLLRLEDGIKRGTDLGSTQTQASVNGNQRKGKKLTVESLFFDSLDMNPLQGMDGASGQETDPKSSSSNIHKSFVDTLLEDRVIWSPLVYETLLEVDFDHFFLNSVPSEVRGNEANRLEALSFYLSKGCTILYSMNKTLFIPFCLTLMAGEEGSVTAFTTSQKKVEALKSHVLYSFLITSNRIRFEVEPDVNHWPRGCPDGGPFDLILAHSQSTAQMVKNQLKPGGVLYVGGRGQNTFYGLKDNNLIQL